MPKLTNKCAICGKPIPMKIKDVKISKGYPGVIYKYSRTPQI